MSRYGSESPILVQPYLASSVDLQELPSACEADEDEEEDDDEDEEEDEDSEETARRAATRRPSMVPALPYR